MARALRRGLLASVLLTSACSSSSEPPPTPTATATATTTARCPSEPIPESRAPDVTPAMEQAEFWLAKLEPGQADAALIGPAERERIASRVAATPGSWRDPIDPALADPAHVEAELGERLEWLRGRVGAGKYVEGQAGALELAAATIASAGPVEETEALHGIVGETPLWCVPMTTGLYTAPTGPSSIDLEFDRNQCASLHLGDLVRVIRRGQGWAYVDAGHSVGWIEEPTSASPIGPAIARASVLDDRERPSAWVLDDWTPPEQPELSLRAGTRLPIEGDAIEVPTRAGKVGVHVGPDAPIQTTPLPLTRRHLLERAFAMLGDPYGWGGRAGYRDCSSMVFDLFAQFDLLLGRNSAVQSQLGVETIELAGQSDQAKRAAIRAAAERGVVLLYMPGHIMIYLGHERVGGVDHDFGISAISDYLVPCPGGSDTVHRLDRVSVTTLELGRGSERRAYLERIERIALFGPTSGPTTE